MSAPPSLPTRPQSFRATHSFIPSAQGEIELREGDVVIADKTKPDLGDGWKHGTNRRSGEYGLFPVNHTRKESLTDKGTYNTSVAKKITTAETRGQSAPRKVQATGEVNAAPHQPVSSKTVLETTTVRRYAVRIRTRKRAARIWFLRNWFLFALIGLAFFGVLLWIIIYFNEDTALVPKNVTRLVNITGFVNEPVNLMVLYDSSGSVGSSNYQTQLLGAATMVETFGGMLDNVSAGGLAWSNRITMDASLSTNVTAVAERIRNSRFQNGGGTLYAPALRNCKSEIAANGQGASNFSRNESFDLCVLISDGLNQDQLSAQQEAKRLTDSGFTVMGILTLGAIPSGQRNAAVRQLYEVTSCPQNVTSFSNITELEMCPYFDTFIDFTTLANTSRAIAESLQKYVDVTVVQTTVENTTVVFVVPVKEANWLWVLVLPLLFYLFWKPIEFYIFSWYVKRVKGTKWERAAWVFGRLLGVKPTQGAAIVEAPENSKAESPPPAALPPNKPSRKGSKYKWDLNSADHYLRGSGAAPMKVDWGTSIEGAPPSAPKVHADNKVLRERVTWGVEDISDSATVQRLAVIYNGGSWQEKISRKFCKCCWVVIDKERDEAAAAAASISTTESGQAQELEMAPATQLSIT